MTSVLFVCMGNICRSPLAEGIFRSLVEERNISTGVRDGIFIDSAGTSGYHVGDPPDGRGIAAARAIGIDMSAQRSRQVAPHDFYDFDHILAMDRDNLRNLESWRPDDARAEIGLFLSYAPHLPLDEMPDPYYGAEDGFKRCIDLVQQGAQGLLKALCEAEPALLGR